MKIFSNNLLIALNFLVVDSKFQLNSEHFSLITNSVYVIKNMRLNIKTSFPFNSLMKVSPKINV